MLTLIIVQLKFDGIPNGVFNVDDVATNFQIGNGIWTDHITVPVITVY